MAVRPPLSAREKRGHGGSLGGGSAKFVTQVIDEVALAASRPPPELGLLADIAPRRRHSTKSASPRPQRLRPVDAVRAAKDELTQEEVPAKSHKLRLAALPAPGDFADVEENDFDGPELHEGFFDFAKTVVKPQPSVRLFAQQLQADLQVALDNVQAKLDDAGAKFEETVTAEADDILDKSLLVQAEAATEQVDKCLGILEQFVVEMTTDCKERTALMGTVRSATTSAAEQLVRLVRSRTQQVLQSTKLREDLESTLEQVEEDNAGLRRVVQQMLSTESDLEARTDAANLEVVNLETKVRETDVKMIHLTHKLQDVTRDFEELQDEESRKRATRDSCNSPMMAFGSFLIGAEELPSTNVVLDIGPCPDAGGLGLSMSGWDRQDAPVPSRAAISRRTLSNVGLRDVPGVPMMPQRSADPVARRSVSGPQSVLPGFDSHGLRLLQPGGMGGGSKASSARPSLRGDANITDVATTLLIPGAEVGPAGATILEDSEDGESSEDGGQMRSHLARSFPALIPFLDFSDLNSSDQGPTKEGEVKTATQEHLERHLSMIQEEYQQELQRSEALQRSVDASLERVLVWVQTVHDSLTDLSSESLAQDVRALAAIRDAVVWLAKHPCKEWNDSPSKLERLLDEHEEEVRKNISQERPPDADMETMRSALAASKLRVDDLSDQLLEARSWAPTGGAALRSPTSRGRPWVSPSNSSGRATKMVAATGGSLSSEGRSQGQLDVGVQCDLLPASGEAPNQILDSCVDEDFAVRTETCPPLGRGAARKPILQVNGARSLGEDAYASRSKDSSSSNDPGGIAEKASQDVLSGGPSTDESMQAGSMESLPGRSSLFPDVQATHGGIADAASSMHEGDEHGVNLKEAETGGSTQVRCASRTSAQASAEREARKLRLLRCQFVEGIDLTLVPLGDRVLLRPPLADGSAYAATIGTGCGGSTGGAALPGPVAPPGLAHGRAAIPGEEKLLSLKQLHAFLGQAFSEKRADDQRRDKVLQPRRQLHVVLQELMRRQHGVRKVVHQKCWQLVESIARHSEADHGALTFADFLDGTRDLGELSFYLYSTKVLANFEEVVSQAQNKPQAGWISVERANRVVDALFCDLPKALAVIQVELDQATRAFEAEHNFSFMSSTEWSVLGGRGADESRVDSEEFLRILLEGWRVSSVFLEKTVPNFSWFQTVLAYMQTDALGRGWLDPHEVREAESHRLGYAGVREVEGLRCLERTSMGAFVFREVHRRSSGIGGGAVASALVIAPAESKINVGKLACLKVSQAVFGSLEKTLGVYLTWLMHSDELGDLAVYHSLKSRMYGFNRASTSADAEQGTHHFRSLLLLLLAHQFDMQLRGGGPSADYLEWEMGCLLRVLRESWRRGAAKIGDEGPPDFGQDLDTLAGHA